MGTTGITVLDLLQMDLKEHDALNLKCIAGRPGLVREIRVAEIDRPGLELAGFLTALPPPGSRCLAAGKRPI